MITVPGEYGKDLCDPNLKLSRRDILRVGGSGMLGLGLAGMAWILVKYKKRSPSRII